MANKNGNDKENAIESRLGGDIALGADDAGAIPKGTIDPVYEAKARVLNRAVSRSIRVLKRCSRLPGTRYWDGMVSMATLYRRWIWMGFRQPLAHCDLPDIHAHHQRVQPDTPSTSHTGTEHWLALWRHVLGVRV